MFSIAINAFSFNSCQLPYKYHLGISPFYANQHLIDSMLDGNGRLARYKYDNVNRVTTDGYWEYAYKSDNLYIGTDGSGVDSIIIYDNGPIGYDSLFIVSSNVLAYKSYFRFNETYEVFENWKATDLLEPTIYDSIVYINSDSLYHYKSNIFQTQKYEYIEGCKSMGSSCDCNEISKTANYPLKIINGPIFIYNSYNQLIERKQAPIFYTSVIVISSSSEGSISSSSQTTNLINIHKMSSHLKRQYFQYDLNGKLLSNKSIDK